MTNCLSNTVKSSASRRHPDISEYDIPLECVLYFEFMKRLYMPTGTVTHLSLTGNITFDDVLCFSDLCE